MDLLKFLVAGLQNIFEQAIPRLRERIEEIVGDAIEASPAYPSLLAGDLRHQMGIVDADGVLRSLVQTIKDSIYIDLSPLRLSGLSILGGITIGILRSDFHDVLAVNGVSFSSENGFTVPWLQWLLFEGEKIIVADFQFVAGFIDFSRTRDGLMVDSHKLHRGWGVPAEFAGTAADNWLTRAISGIPEAVIAVIQDEIGKRF